MNTIKEFDTGDTDQNSNTVRKLVFKENGWRFEIVPAPELESNGIPIIIESVLVPSETLDVGFWVGHNANSTNARYAGWGPLADLFTYQTTDLFPLDHEMGLSAILSVIACSIVQPIQNLGPATHVGVVGEGLLSEMSNKYLENRVTLHQPTTSDSLDLLIDTTGEPTCWNNALPKLRGEGTLLLFVPPWSKPATFNFYPQLHRNSLRVEAKRWHLPQPALDTSLSAIMSPVISAIEQEGKWIRPLILESNSRENGVWYWIDWK